MLDNSDVLALLGCPQRSDEATRPSPTELLKKLVQSWLSTARSSEPMMRGTANESAVLSALSKMPFFVALFECCMLAGKETPWLACSPDTVALIDAKSLDLSENGQQELAAVEIKTNIAASSLDKALSRATGDVQTCLFGDVEFQRLIPREHWGQILQQVVILSAHYVVYVSATETGIIYVVVVQVPVSVVDKCVLALNQDAKEEVAWAHESEGHTPSFADADTRRVIEKRLPFWKLVNVDVVKDGPFPPLKLFKHVSQSLYSKTKCGVNGATQYRAILRSPVSVLKWEQKLVSQTLKTVVVNAFTAWLMRERRDRLESMETFGCLKMFRNAINKVQSFGDFVFEVCSELLRYADRIGTREKESLQTYSDARIEPTDAEGARLRKLAKERKTNRVEFFSSKDGIAIRLAFHPHFQIHKFKEGIAHCVARVRRGAGASVCAQLATCTFAFAYKRISESRAGLSGMSPDISM